MIKIYEKIPLQVFSDDLKDVFWAIRLLNSGSCPYCRRICPKMAYLRKSKDIFVNHVIIDFPRTRARFFPL